MILIWLILLPLLGGVAAWLIGRRSARAARWTALAPMIVGLGISIVLASQAYGAPGGTWIAEIRWSWIPEIGISLHFAADGLSAVMVVLTYFLGAISIGAAWRDIEERVGFFFLCLLGLISGIVGVFLSVDLFVFYLFWELMLVPMYFVISVWGHANSRAAAIKFFIFTQLSGLLMLLAILGLVFAHHDASGVLTFDYAALLGTQMGARFEMLLMLGFFAAFGVKLPVVPLHSWLPDAHTEAPTAGSVVLAGLMLKTGAYGFIRFLQPLFPDAAARFAPVAMWMGAAGVVYGAWMAFAQTDAKRLVAYTSVSHLGFVLLAVFAWNTYAVHGAVLQMICHGLSTGALFVVVGALQERLGTRQLDAMGGLWSRVPRLGALAVFFALASLGLPGLGNFVAEFLALLGSFEAARGPTILATAGLVLATVYALWFVQQAFHGEASEGEEFGEADTREVVLLGSMALLLVVLGLYPAVVTETVGVALESLLAGGSP